MAIKETHIPTQRGQVRENTNTIGQAVDQTPNTTEPAAPTGQPKVSVVIPTLNEARNLETLPTSSRCRRSLPRPTPSSARKRC